MDENRGYLPTHEVNTSVHAHEGASPHVPDQTIVLDWEITARTIPNLPGRGRGGGMSSRTHIG